MGGLGLVLVILGIAGFVADDVVTISVEYLAPLTTASWVLLGVGALLCLVWLLMETELGAGVFPLVIGVGALVAQAVVRWVDIPAVHAWQPWIGIGVAALIAGGAAGVIWSLCWEDEPDSAVALLALFAISSLVADVVYDFGSWDQLVNVATAVFAASCAVLGQWTMNSGDIEVLRGVRRDRVRAREPGWDHPVVRFALAVGLRVAAVGLGAAGVLVTALASVDLPTWAGVLLVLPAVLGGFLALLVVAVPLLVRAVGVERFTLVDLDVVDDVFDDRRHWYLVVASCAGGYLVVATVVELIVFRPVLWLTIPLAVPAAVGAVVVWRIGKVSWSRLVERVVGWADLPVNRTPTLRQVLADLGKQDAVHRLVPGSETLA